MKEIKLTQDKVALVDDEDFEYLNQWKWHTLKQRNRLYAIRSKGTKPFQKTISMHQQIMEFPKGMHIDHIDGNGLNNQSKNLRICTNSQNLANRNKNITNTSGYKGVSLYKATGKWKASISVSGKLFYLGCYNTPEEAAKAYDEAARKYQKEFAVFNF